MLSIGSRIASDAFFRGSANDPQEAFYKLRVKLAEFGVGLQGKEAVG
jgi:hypothetical protein